MQKIFMSMLVGSCVVVSTQAAEDAELASVCDKLAAALEQQVEALTSIKDEETASAYLPKVNESLAAQKALFGVDERELWNYIDHRDEVKVPLMRVLQRLAAQIDRLQKADFYGNRQLKQVLL